MPGSSVSAATDTAAGRAVSVFSASRSNHAAARGFDENWIPLMSFLMSFAEYIWHFACVLPILAGYAVV